MANLRDAQALSRVVQSSAMDATGRVLTGDAMAPARRALLAAVAVAAVPTAVATFAMAGRSPVFWTIYLAYCAAFLLMAVARYRLEDDVSPTRWLARALAIGALMTGAVWRAADSLIAPWAVAMDASQVSGFPGAPLVLAAAYAICGLCAIAIVPTAERTIWSDAARRM